MGWDGLANFQRMECWQNKQSNAVDNQLEKLKQIDARKIQKNSPQIPDKMRSLMSNYSRKEHRKRRNSSETLQTVSQSKIAQRKKK